jgi:mRNA-degrading endonuclease HigB of HigAB toxin-antitoxin module
MNSKGITIICKKCKDKKIVFNISKNELKLIQIRDNKKQSLTTICDNCFNDSSNIENDR